MSKKTFKDSSIDWGVWHFVGDLPSTQTEMLHLTFHRVNEVEETLCSPNTYRANSMLDFAAHRAEELLRSAVQLK